MDIINTNWMDVTELNWFCIGFTGRFCQKSE
jgi:hypothetical protein